VEAIKEMNGAMIDGRKIIVEKAGEPKKKSTGPSPTDKCFSCGKVGHWFQVFLRRSY